MRTVRQRFAAPGPQQGQTETRKPNGHRWALLATVNPRTPRRKFDLDWMTHIVTRATFGGTFGVPWFLLLQNRSRDAWKGDEMTGSKVKCVSHPFANYGYPPPGIPRRYGSEKSRERWRWRERKMRKMRKGIWFFCLGGDVVTAGVTGRQFCQGSE